MVDDPNRLTSPELLASSAVARIQKFRSEFTLSMYFQRGPAWEAVSAFRKAWKVTAQVGCPEITTETATMAIFYPSEMVSEPPISPFQPIDPVEAAGFNRYPRSLIGDEDINDRKSGVRIRVAWFRDLKRMHDLLVPEDCRSYFPIPAMSWMTFLSLAVVNEPPPDQLIEYAESTILFDLPPGLDQEQEGPDLETARYAMIHAPVLHIRDETAIEQAWSIYVDAILDSLAKRLASEYDINLNYMIDDLDDLEPNIGLDLEARLAAIPVRIVIPVDEYTTPTDVQNAYRLIRETIPPRPTGKAAVREARSFAYSAPSGMTILDGRTSSSRNGLAGPCSIRLAKSHDVRRRGFI